MLDIEGGETVMENIPWVFLAALIMFVSVLTFALIKARRDKN